MDETLGKLGRVELLEHILVLYIFEQNHLYIQGKKPFKKLGKTTHHLIQGFLQILLLRDFVVLSQQCIGMLGDQLWRFGRRGARCSIPVDKFAAGL
jgi:hypothetical protein